MMGYAIGGPHWVFPSHPEPPKYSFLFKDLPEINAPAGHVVRMPGFEAWRIEVLGEHTVAIQAPSVAAAIQVLCAAYGRTVDARPVSYVPLTPDSPPPPDWVEPEAAGVCPECGGTGSVMLFLGPSPCKTCSSSRQ